MDTIIELLSTRLERDAYGVDRKVVCSRQVYARVLSVARSEFFEAGRNGLNPMFKIIIFHGDYAGETMIRYEDQPYAVYRTYHVPGTDDLELYVERKGGTNGKA